MKYKYRTVGNNWNVSGCLTNFQDQPVCKIEVLDISDDSVTIADDCLGTQLI